MAKRLNGPNRLLHSQLYKLPAQGQPAAVGTGSTHWRNAPLPWHRPVLPVEHGHGKAMLISEGCTPLTCTRSVLQRCNPLGRSGRSVCLQAAPVGTGGESPDIPGSTATAPSPAPGKGARCYRGRGVYT